MAFNAQETAAINGFATWKSIEVSRIVTEPVSYLKFDGVEPMVNGAIVGQQLMLGNRVKATLGGQQVFDGYVTIRQAFYDSKNRGVQLVAASRPRDAVTATVKSTPGQYRNQTVQQMCSAVCGPIGLSVSVLANNVTFPRVSEQPGETIMAFMQRLARHANLHAWDDANGNLYFGNFSGGSTGATLTEGGNILAARFHADDQWADAVVNGLGQNVGGSASNVAGTDAAQVKATVANPGFMGGGVARQATIIADLPVTPAILNLRAQHEVELMNIDQLDIRVTVQGWFAPSGSLWLLLLKGGTPTISLNSPSLYPGTISLKLKGVRSMQNDKEGTTSELILTNERGLQSGPSIGAPAAPAP